MYSRAEYSKGEQSGTPTSSFSCLPITHCLSLLLDPRVCERSTIWGIALLRTEKKAAANDIAHLVDLSSHPVTQSIKRIGTFNGKHCRSDDRALGGGVHFSHSIDIVSLCTYPPLALTGILGCPPHANQNPVLCLEKETYSAPRV